MNRERKLAKNCVIILSLIGQHRPHVLAAYLMTEYITNNVCFHIYVYASSCKKANANNA